MYPISLGFDEAIMRIKALVNNDHYAEALVTSVFTLEKTMSRSLKIAILARGFSINQTKQLLHNKGFNELKSMWDLFDKEYRGLPKFIGNEYWQNIPTAVKMRNDLVHGNRVYKPLKCKQFAEYVLSALDKLQSKVQIEYGRNPWEKISGRRKPKLQWLCK